MILRVSTGIVRLSAVSPYGIIDWLVKMDNDSTLARSRLMSLPRRLSLSLTHAPFRRTLNGLPSRLGISKVNTLFLGVHSKACCAALWKHWVMAALPSLMATTSGKAVVAG